MSLLLTIFLKFFSVISNAEHAFSYILDYLFLRPYTIYGITMSVNIFWFLIHFAIFISKHVPIYNVIINS